MSKDARLLQLQPRCPLPRDAGLAPPMPYDVSLKVSVAAVAKAVPPAMALRVLQFRQGMLLDFCDKRADFGLNTEQFDVGVGRKQHQVCDIVSSLLPASFSRSRDHVTAACTVLCGDCQMHAPAIMFQVTHPSPNSPLHALICLQAALLQYVLVAKATVPSDAAMFNAGLHW